VLAIFGLLAVWRIARRGVWRDREQPVALAAGVIGVAVLLFAASLGGKLVFDHGLGIRTERLQQIPAERTGHEHDEDEASPASGARPPMPADTAKAGAARLPAATAKH